MWDLVRQCQLRVQHLELPALHCNVLWLGDGAEYVDHFEGLAETHTIRVVGESSDAALTVRVDYMRRTGDWREGQRRPFEGDMARRVARVELNLAGRVR